MKASIFYVVLLVLTFTSGILGAKTKTLNDDQLIRLMTHTDTSSIFGEYFLGDESNYKRVRGGYLIEDVEFEKAQAELHANEEGKSELLLELVFHTQALQGSRFEQVRAHLVQLFSRCLGNPYLAHNIDWWEDEGGDKRDIYIWRISDRILFLNVRRYEKNIKYLSVFASNYDLLLRTGDKEDAQFWRNLVETDAAKTVFSKQGFPNGPTESSATSRREPPLPEASQSDKVDEFARVENKGYTDQSAPYVKKTGSIIFVALVLLGTLVGLMLYKKRA